MITSLLHSISDVISLLIQIVPRIIPYSFSPSDLPLPHGNKSYIDILTYNVEFLAFRGPCCDKILSAVQQSDAEIVCLQETNENWEERLVDRFGESYPHRHFVHPTKNQRSAGGSAILSRFPISNVTTVDLCGSVEGSVFPTLVATVVIPYREECVRIANVHLRPPLNLDGSAGFSTARETGSIREVELDRIMVRDDNNTRLDIVAGDFNEGDGGHAVLHARRYGFRNALEEFVPRWKETHRWPFLVGTTLYKRLDRVLYRRDRGMSCVGCGVITGFETGGSDHQPVLARFCV